MTRANLNVKLSNGVLVQCVCDSSSAPEHGYIVEHLLFPLLEMNDSERELGLLMDKCEMFQQCVNADYRYTINLLTKAVHFHEENYDCGNNRFYTGRNLTGRLRDYMDSADALLDMFWELNIKTEDQ